MSGTSHASETVSIATARDTAIGLAGSICEVATSQPRVLIISQRNICRDVLFRCPHYEFEDLICEMDSVDVLAPSPGKGFPVRYGVAKKLAWHLPVALNPGIAKVRIDKTYDLLFMICGSPVDLLTLNGIAHWRKLAKTSICLVDELWVKELPAYRYFLENLAMFDFIMMYYSQSVKPVQEVLRRPCCFLPPGVDSIAFCPYPAQPARVVDVYSIGRRSSATHQELLRLAQGGKIFYVYDSILGGTAINWRDHRSLLANVAKRSRYFLVNPALVDQSEIRGSQNESGNRFFEGCAAGAIMIGEAPDNAEFARLFDWPDALLAVPYGSTDMGRVMEAMNGEPDRQAMIRRNNVLQALTRHDWAYRWETLLKLAGLPALRGLVARKERLKGLIQDISAASGFGPSAPASPGSVLAEYTA